MNMHIALILTHVTFMIGSLLLMPTAILLAIRGIRASLPLATCGVVAASIGFVTGIVMLLTDPLLTECIILTAYLVAMISVYAVGFGWGVASRARLLKGAVS